MATYLKINPVGIDIVIQKLQTSLYSALNWQKYESYGRAYKNKKSGQTIPEVFISNKDYREVLLDDKVNASSFFIAGDNITYNEMATAKVSLIVQCDLLALYAGIAHRADEEMHEEIIRHIKQNDYADFIGITTGIEQVYSDLNIDIKYTDDMQKYHVVKFDFEVIYNYNC